ncbi:3-alpha,7-alpha,12-alpha-trihydroxy-5-beta-cholest-24-enoyl-CoA hydratase [Sneathiella chungangensis]|uniref:3-alpha,7-alpha, 12-alpha-trihydroxy-5-beta-cholest-24-enoyl-CoA hydratase n=1 Tax=Sneathiella chungangensis TaxID=1418234 RepID=A0A845MGK5_9PROT|nr:MaoC family dehydratase [Sneathiella chungangensis]MZR22801.1 3-alpha,7-alpha,12-alpha-trihydroxy-5-beta-cholest-24-enoyl-CoA hydratase [Sneathiella chungangensis]
MINQETLLNWPFEDVIQTYTKDNSIFYALSIGLGYIPTDVNQLQYVYENNLVSFPTMAAVLGTSTPITADPNSGIDRTKVVHGEQGLTIFSPLPAEGTIRARDKIVDVIDKGEGRGALVVIERSIANHQNNELLAKLTSTIFCRANGGFGGKPGKPAEPKTPPERTPDIVVGLPSTPQSALYYRLNADRNPLHADPAVAAQAGFPAPILHGLCSWGMAAHAVVKACCDYDASRLSQFECRFTKPVFPGETISVDIWRSDNEARFRAWVRERDAMVLDNGFAKFA